MTIHMSLHGTRLVVEYNHTPAQLQTHTDPGHDETVEVLGVHTEQGSDIIGLFECNSSLQEALDEALLEAHRDRYADEY